MRVKILRERVSAWIEAPRAVEETVAKLTQLLRELTVTFHGGYVRGDFNLWSDIDFIVVSPIFEKH